MKRAPQVFALLVWTIAQPSFVGHLDESAAEEERLVDACGGNSQNRNAGARLFERETFGGNGRTCATCHAVDSAFTMSPEKAQALFAANPDHPLFKQDGSDDGLGNGVSRMLTHATIRITIPLPPNIRLASDPSATAVTLNRGIFTLLDSPAVERPSVVSHPALMWDGRAPDLQAQALDAILTHAEPTDEISPQDLEKIARYQSTEDFFTSAEMRAFACGDGPAPGLPEGTTDSERRGRAFFVSRPQPTAPPFELRCSTCHSGPLLNENDANQPLILPPNAGTKFNDVAVQSFNRIGNPMLDFVVENPDGTTWTVTTADPGRILVAGQTPHCPSPACIPCGPYVPFNPSLAPKAGNICAVIPFDTVAFKIPTLRNIRNTAPYFHDNSAKNLDELMDHYVDFFEFVFLLTGGAIDGRLSEQDVEDIKAFMLLL